jgi:hypothetical protein
VRSVLLPGSQDGLADGDKGFLCLIKTLTPNQTIHAKTGTDLFKIESNSDPPHELMIQALHWTSKPLFFLELTQAFHLRQVWCLFAFRVSEFTRQKQ